MDFKSQVYDKITNSLDIIFSYSLKRTKDRYEAEELSQEIIVNLYYSALNLKDIEKINGWMWGVASNVYKTHVRKQIKNRHKELEDDMKTSTYEEPLEIIIQNEQIGFLYREISRLAGIYREATKLYYLESKSCDEVAKSLNISNEMVKQYLFKSRRKIKEGITVFKENGERSFNPRKFNIYYWGEQNNYLNKLFKKILPGNILLEAYYDPVTVEQLSIELGVATVYLEDEIKVLFENGLLNKLRGDKYHSNIIVFTQEFEKELAAKTFKTIELISDRFHKGLKSVEKAIRNMNLHNSFDSNTFMWQLSTVCFTESLRERFIDKIITEYPSLVNGGEGFFWGVERNYGDNNFDLGFSGYQGEESSQIIGVDYHILGSSNSYLYEKMTSKLLLKVAKSSNATFNELEEEILISLIQKGVINNTDEGLELNMPVYTSSQYKSMIDILEPILDLLYSSCLEMLPTVEKTLSNFVPSKLKGQVKPISSLKQIEHFVIHIMDNLYMNKHILVPDSKKHELTTYIII